MTKTEMEKHLKERVRAAKVINEKIIVFYKQDFQGIINLKKDLRLLTKKYEDFYKRVNGFYNNNISINLYRENETVDTFAAITLFINTEEEAEAVREVIVNFVESFYKRETYYTVNFSSDFLNYKINELDLNELEFLDKSNEIVYNRKKGDKTLPQDLFETKLEAKREAYRIVSAKVDEINNILRLLKETQTDISEDIKNEIK